MAMQGCSSSSASSSTGSTSPIAGNRPIAEKVPAAPPEAEIPKVAINTQGQATGTLINTVA